MVINMRLKQKNWSKKLRHNKKRNSFELQIEQAFELVDNQVDFKDPSNLKADVPLSLLNQEKLARAVIDQADLMDASEKERRKNFDRLLRKKRIIRAVVACGIVAALVVAMVLGGVFDRVNIDTYDAGIYVSNTYSADKLKYPTESLEATFYNYELLTEGMLEEDYIESEDEKYFLFTKDTKNAPKVNDEKLSDSLDKILSTAMTKLDYAYDEKYILGKEYCKDEKGNWYLYVSVLATCIDYNPETEDALKWKDCPDYMRISEMIMAGDYEYYGCCFDKPQIPYEFLTKAGDLSTKTYITISDIIVVL